jgi:glycosyltransferase EpsD
MLACDLYVSASTSEGLPFNIVEALGCGKTVLASRIKGHTDILDGGAGLTFGLDMPREFEEKLYDVYANGSVVSAEHIAAGYRNFSEAVVFDDTYAKLKGACELE